MIRGRVITCSDAAAGGRREDRSGPAVRELMTTAGIQVDEVQVLPDDLDLIAAAIQRAASTGIRLIVTTGGTGLAPRDVTPEATARVSERNVPGFGELMRATSRMGALSRAGAATLGEALIVNLPGSVNGATECFRAVAHLIPHALELLQGGRVERHPEP